MEFSVALFAVLLVRYHIIKLCDRCCCTNYFFLQIAVNSILSQLGPRSTHPKLKSFLELRLGLEVEFRKGLELGLGLGLLSGLCDLVTV